MYKKCYAQSLGRGTNKHRVHLWTDEGYEQIEWSNYAYRECVESQATHRGLNGEFLKKTLQWKSGEQDVHFHDIKVYQKFLIEKYGTDDTVSKTHKEVFFDIEIEMGGALTEDYISRAPKPVTSIAWWDKQLNHWAILILDKWSKLNYKFDKNEETKEIKEIIPCKTEDELLKKFIEKMTEIEPDILIGYNSDYFDIPYLYHRIKNECGKDWSKWLSPIGIVRSRKETQFIWPKDLYVEIAGVSSLDYMKMHRKYSMRDEPSWKLDDIGSKYAGLNKIEYEGSLDKLFEEDINKFIEYNFRDVEILKVLDEKLQYIDLTKNLCHKGKINYTEVYASSKIHDGAISAYLLEQNRIPPPRDYKAMAKQAKGHKEHYAGGYLLCPNAGLYGHMFDEDLTSLYPTIIMSLNIGRETLIGKITGDSRGRLGLDDLKEKDPKSKYYLVDIKGKQATCTVEKILKIIEEENLSISANGVLFSTKTQSVLSAILGKWFMERVYYKKEMKKAFSSGNEEKGKAFHLLQYTMKILLNSLYGATALPSFRFGNIILSEAITLTGQRIIQESALFTNTHMNKVLRGEIELEL